MKYKKTLVLFLLVSLTNNFAADAGPIIEKNKKYKIKRNIQYLPEGLMQGDLVQIQADCKEMFNINSAIDMTMKEMGTTKVAQYLAVCQKPGLTFEEIGEIITSNNTKELIDPKYHGPFFYIHNYTAAKKHRDALNKKSFFPLEAIAGSCDACVHASWLEGPIKDRK